jgi:hypothetical protein
MPDFVALDVALGLMFVYLVLSVACSAVNEAFASLSARRAKFLVSGLENLLGVDLKNALLGHPLVRPLAKPGSRPSYIPSWVFARALLDLRSDRPELFTIEDAGLTEVGKAVAKLTEQAGAQMDELRKSLESWFDDAMERVSGWYRRRTQLWLWVIGVVVVVFLNVDTLRITSVLWNDRAVREVVVAEVEAAAGATDVSEIEVADVREKLGELRIPLGWSTAEDSVDLPDDATGWISKLFGLLISTAALALGAPFWFDLLGKVSRLRGAGGQPKRGGETPGG